MCASREAGGTKRVTKMNFVVLRRTDFFTHFFEHVVCPSAVYFWRFGQTFPRNHRTPHTDLGVAWKFGVVPFLFPEYGIRLAVACGKCTVGVKRVPVSRFVVDVECDGVFVVGQVVADHARHPVVVCVHTPVVFEKVFGSRHVVRLHVHGVPKVAMEHHEFEFLTLFHS